MAHQIKIDRARHLAVIGACGGSYEHMISLIPPSALGGLTARTIAELADTLWHACQEAKSIATREIIANRAVWDADLQVMRDLAA